MSIVERQPGYESKLCHLLVLLPRVNSLTSQVPNFLYHKVRIVKIADYCKEPGISPIHSDCAINSSYNLDSKKR